MLTSKFEATLFVASIKAFNGSNERPAEADENGHMPIIIDVVAGSCPNKRVLSGTVAMRAGMIIGKNYLCKAEEVDETDYGRQFRFSTVVQLGIKDLLGSIKLFGAPKLIEVVENEPELTKSGNYSYPKGFTLKERTAFDEMDLEEQDAYIIAHPDIRSHKSITAK